MITKTSRVKPCRSTIGWRTALGASIGLLLAACGSAANQTATPAPGPSTPSCWDTTVSPHTKAPPSASPGTGGPTSPDDPRWAEFSKATEVAEQIQTLARAEFPDVFAGIKLNDTSIVVYRVPTAGNPLDVAVHDKYSTAPVTFTNVPKTETALKDLVDRVAADADTYWPTHDVTIAEVGPDAATGKVDIHAVQAADVVEAKLLDRYGPGIAVHGGASPSCPF